MHLNKTPNHNPPLSSLHHMIHTTTSKSTLSHPLLSKLEASPSLAHFHQIHAQIITTGLFANVFAASRLLKFAAAVPNLPLTTLLFSRTKHPDVFSYNVVIKAHSLSSSPLTALSYYKGLLLRGLHPNEYTLCFLLACCSRALALWEGRQLHAHLHKHGFHAATFSATSLVHMYGDCAVPRDASRAFEQMPLRSNVSWGALIDASGDAAQGLRLFGELRRLHVVPTEATLVSVLCACTELRSPGLGRMVHACIAVTGTEFNAVLGTALMDMYFKCGLVETAVQVFSVMATRNVVAWNCLIHGLAVNGHESRAITMFEEMEQNSDALPNEVTFLGLLRACSHKGLIEDGVRYFSCMKVAYGIAPSLKHYGCMVDLFGRAGRIREAMEVIRGMPVVPDAVIWVALIGACGTHGHQRLAELVTAKIIKMVPQDSCGYLLLSDMYASSERWDDVSDVRRMMVEMSIRKVPGCSSISN